MTAESVIRPLSLKGEDRLWLDRAEALHRAFRPALPADYAGHLAIMADEGAEMAVLTVGEAVRAIAVYRSHHTTFGRRFYIDDLVTDEAERSRGHGRALLAWCEAQARERDCDWLDLESGTQRTRAHGFYFREGMHVFAFSFRKALGGG